MEEDKELNKTEVVQTAAKPDKSDKKDRNDDKKDSRRSLKSTLGDYRGEYNKIIWPTKEVLVKETIIVIVTCIILGAVINTFDLVYAEGYQLLIGAFVK